MKTITIQDWIDLNELSARSYLF